MTTLILIRGLPGSGKTTFARRLIAEPVSADDYFTAGGKYVFRADQLTAAHEWCQTRVAKLLSVGMDVAVANTFSRRWEWAPYLEMGADRVFVVDLFDGGLTDAELAARNVHGVGADAIRRMRERWER